MCSPAAISTRLQRLSSQVYRIAAAALASLERCGFSRDPSGRAFCGCECYFGSDSSWFELLSDFEIRFGLFERCAVGWRLSLSYGQNNAFYHGSVTPSNSCKKAVLPLFTFQRTSYCGLSRFCHDAGKKKRLPFWQALQNGVGCSIKSSKNSSFSCINRQTPSASSRCCKS